MSLNRIVLAGFAAAASASLLVMAPTAAAAPTVGPTPTSPATPEDGAEEYQQVPPEDIAELVENLEASELPRTHDTVEGESVTAYKLDNGSTITVPDDWDKPRPLASAGPALAGPWIELTPAEQQLAAAGGSAALTAAICSTGVGCPVASAVSAIATTWIGQNGGICANNGRLLIEVTWAGQLRGASCR